MIIGWVGEENQVVKAKGYILERLRYIVMFK